MSLGHLPGVNELPVRAALPDVLVMNDDTKVTTAAQWRLRREEMKRTLEYYATGRMPPGPKQGKSQDVLLMVGQGTTTNTETGRPTLSPVRMCGRPARRAVLDGPTTTLDKLHGHINTPRSRRSPEL